MNTNSGSNIPKSKTLFLFFPLLFLLSSNTFVHSNEKPKSQEVFNGFLATGQFLELWVISWIKKGLKRIVGISWRSSEA